MINLKGEPAFTQNEHSTRFPCDSGMSLRDYFAAKAVQFIQWNTDNTSICAKRCYEIADAMIEARQK